jgi:uncharacterized protein YkwD
LLATHKSGVPVRVVPPPVRTIAVIVALVGVLVPAAAIAASGPGVVPVDDLESAVLDELNLVRLEHGLRPVRLHDRLTAAADRHSLEMVAAGYFGHESSDGGQFWARIKAFYRPRASRRPWMVGENLIWNTDRLSARTAVTRWLASPGHRENLLRPAYRDVGISAVRACAPGVFGNRRVIVITVDFGTR